LEMVVPELDCWRQRSGQEAFWSLHQVPAACQM
jgi:hypothetical protein